MYKKLKVLILNAILLGIFRQTVCFCPTWKKVYRRPCLKPQMYFLCLWKFHMFSRVWNKCFNHYINWNSSRSFRLDMTVFEIVGQLFLKVVEHMEHWLTDWLRLQLIQESERRSSYDNRHLPNGISIYSNANVILFGSHGDQGSISSTFYIQLLRL